MIGLRARFMELTRARLSKIEPPFPLRDKPKETGPSYDPLWRQMSSNWVGLNGNPHTVSLCWRRRGTARAARPKAIERSAPASPPQCASIWVSVPRSDEEERRVIDGGVLPSLGEAAALPMKPNRRDAAILCVLTVITAALAGCAAYTGRASWLEAFSFVTGAVCVWLTVKESAWNFPVSLVNVVAFSVVFAKARLFADAGLQGVYFLLTLQGWYLWVYGGEGRTSLRISRAPRRELLIVALFAACATAGLTIYLRSVGDALPFWDALTTTLSLCAQWLLNRKYVESWYVWIAVDVLYIPMYAYKELY
jgi:nicotinamide mononucleotide transporter